MEFIAVLIALGLERLWDGVSSLRYDGWFEPYQALWDKVLGSQSLWAGYIKLVGLVLPILIVLLLLHSVFEWVFGDIGWLFFSLLVLVYCLGPGNLYGQVKRCISSSDEQGTQLVLEHVNQFFGLDLKENNAAARVAFSHTVLSVANQRIFTVMFWFALLGPVGALLYRLVVLCRTQSSMANAATVSQSVLEWVPVRLLALAYALTGNFIAVFPVWFKHLYKGLDDNNQVLMACADAAFGFKAGATHKDIQPAQAIALLDRSLVLSLVVLGLIFIL